MSVAVSEDYAQRFGGVARLYGQAGLQRLRAAHVCVIGVGGVGSWTVVALARSGVGALTMIDLDDVCVTNVNRQLPALDGQIGRPKVEALGERVRLIHPDCEVNALTEFFTAASAARLLEPPYDFVVDATNFTVEPDWHVISTAGALDVEFRASPGGAITPEPAHLRTACRQREVMLRNALTRRFCRGWCSSRFRPRTVSSARPRMPVGPRSHDDHGVRTTLPVVARCSNAV